MRVCVAYSGRRKRNRRLRLGHLAAARGDRRRQRLVQCMVDQLMHGARFAETHFDLGGMDVDVHHFRVDFDEQYKRRMAVVVQNVLVGLADGVGDQLVAHETAVDVDILRIAAAARKSGQARQALQAQAAGTLVQRHRGSGKFLAQQGRGTLHQAGRRQLPDFAPVMLQAETDIGAAQWPCAGRFPRSGRIRSPRS